MEEKNNITLSLTIPQFPLLTSETVWDLVWTRCDGIHIVGAESCIYSSFCYQFKGRRENINLTVTSETVWDLEWTRCDGSEVAPSFPVTRRIIHLGFK